MAYEIIGTVHKISAIDNIQTKNGSTFQRRSITLMQKRYDQNTGEEYEPNFPTIEFAQQGCNELEKYKHGDRVRIRFDLSGTRYNDRTTGEERYFTSLRGFRIEPYVPAGQPQYIQQPYMPAGHSSSQQSQVYTPQRPQQAPYQQPQADDLMPF